MPVFVASNLVLWIPQTLTPVPAPSLGLLYSESESTPILPGAFFGRPTLPLLIGRRRLMNQFYCVCILSSRLYTSLTTIAARSLLPHPIPVLLLLLFLLLLPFLLLLLLLPHHSLTPTGFWIQVVRSSCLVSSCLVFEGSRRTSTSSTHSPRLAGVQAVNSSSPVSSHLFSSYLRFETHHSSHCLYSYLVLACLRGLSRDPYLAHGPTGTGSCPRRRLSFS